MDNTYIQNKLDAFKEYLVLDENSEEEFSNEILTNKLKEVITEAYNQGKTDYHNHIVEKIDSISPLESNNAIDYRVKIKSLLQDTNPKE